MSIESEWSPTDLNHFLECEHLIQLDRGRVARVERERDPHAALLAAKGLEHEHTWLNRFVEEGRRIVDIRGGGPRGLPALGSDVRRGGPSGPSAGVDWARDAERTLAAMRAGADVIYQGVLLERDVAGPEGPARRGAVHPSDIRRGGPSGPPARQASGNWRGISDFLVRTDTPSNLGRWSYEAWDTKLARHSKPYFILQLCFYTGQIGRLQGLDPGQMHVVLGTGETESFRYADFDAYYRAVRRRFLESARNGVATYPHPVSYCNLCEHTHACESRREEDDHLSLVAQMRREQVQRLNEAGVHTVAQLATIDLERRVGVSRPTLERLRHQAALQAHHRTTGTHTYELLEVDEHTGFRLLPAPSAGDIFFDMEGDPYYEPAGGLEYLFGVLTVDPTAAPAFRYFRALTREEEKVAFERFIDVVHDRLRLWPDLHVYHYAPYETTALKRLMSAYATREDELDDLLRREVFVDLYQVVRQSLRMSHSSYSIKHVRTFFMEGAGQGSVIDGGDSILEFERWRACGDPAILEAIVAYNEEDCRSTLKLRDWLIERKQEAERTNGLSIPCKEAGGADEKKPERADDDALTAQRRAALDAIGTAAARLLAGLLGYHRREAKPEWWAYFDRRKKSLDDLIDDTQAIARLERVSGVEDETVARSLVHTLQFPPQEFKLRADPKAQVEDPFRQASAGTIAWLDAQGRRLGLKRGLKRRNDPIPTATVASKPLDTKEQRAALGRVADDVIDGRGVPARYAAIRNVLDRAAPRIRGVSPGTSIQTLDLTQQQALVAALDDSYLFIQGPPGSGKTWTGARLIVSLMQAGNRVGVAANSHKAINNLLKEVEQVAVATGVTFTGLKKGTDEDELRGRFIRDTDSNEACEAAEVDLIAGTSWLFSRTKMDRRLDYLFIDEAGQVALADAIAMGTAARNLVFLGDPQQLPQVRQGVHLGRSGCSVLEHLLGVASTVPEDRGLFLSRTWRMHPDVCDFISNLAYDGRLVSAPGRERQRIGSPGLSGTGLRFMPVEHAGNAQQSPEEAAAIAREVERLLDGGTCTDSDGRTRPLTPADILIVAPYNMQVRGLADVLPRGVEVGTVDKFQGREAPVVFFSMASSSGEDVPRGLEFLFSRNRFNVAVSRAKAMAVLVCSPRLLDVTCRTVEQMRLVNAVCGFVEASDRSPAAAPGAS